ncbi:MAG TPA: MFS transporter [Caulobacteraceae bacterium]|nr:MFS transporter [Caulobacteraceae bacterium]
MAPTRVHPWVIFIALSLLFFLVSAGTFSTLGVVLTDMVRELGWNWKQAGLGYTLLGVACGLTSMAAAASIRRIGVRLTTALGGVLLASGFGALALTRSALVYLIGTSLLGVAFSFSTTVGGTHVLTAIFKRQSTVIGAYFTIGALGGVAGPLIYNVVGPTAGWRSFWWLFAAAAVVLAGFAAAVTPDRIDHEAAPPEQADPATLIADLDEWTVRRALRTSQFYVIVGAYTMYLLINTTAHGFAVEHLIERGISQSDGAVMLSIEALIGAAVSVIGGVMGEKVGPRTLLIWCMITLIIGMCALAVAHGYWMMGLYAVGVGIGYGLSFVAATMLLLTYFGRRAYLELYSIMCLLSTFAAVGPAVGGWARDTLGSFEGVFFLSAFSALVMLVATLFMKKPVPARPAA